MNISLQPTNLHKPDGKTPAIDQFKECTDLLLHLCSFLHSEPSSFFKAQYLGATRTLSDIEKLCTIFNTLQTIYKNKAEIDQLNEGLSSITLGLCKKALLELLNAKGSQVTTLNLSNQPLTEYEIIKILKVCPNLKKLSLSGCLSPNYSEPIDEKIQKVIPHLPPHLISLDLGCNLMSDTEANLLFKLSNLTELHLDMTRISYEKACFLIENLPNLRVLSLKFNGISAEKQNELSQKARDTIVYF